MLWFICALIFSIFLVCPSFLFNYLPDNEIGLFYGLWTILTLYISSQIGISNAEYIGDKIDDILDIIYYVPIVCAFTIPLLIFIKVNILPLKILILILASYICGINIWFFLSGLVGLLVFRFGFPADPFIAPCIAFFNSFENKEETLKKASISLDVILASILGLYLICNFSCMCAYIVGSLLKQNRGEYFVLTNVSLPIVSSLYMYLYGDVKIMPLGYVYDPISFCVGYLASLVLGIIIIKNIPKIKLEFDNVVFEIIFLIYNAIFGLYNLLLYIMCRILSYLRWKNKKDEMSHFGYFIIPTMIYYFRSFLNI